MSLPTRATDELRPIEFILDYVMHPEGSVLITAGNTRVLCNATVEEKLPPWLRYSRQPPRLGHGRVCDVATQHQQPQQSETLSPHRAHTGDQRLIGRSLRGAVDLNILGERQIIVDCDVIQADGGTRTAAVTGGYVALALAIKRLEKRGAIAAGALLDAVAAVSVGIVDGKAVLDLDYALDLAADVDMNVVMTDKGHFVEVQGTAEGKPFSRTALNAMLALAELGIQELLQKQQAALAGAVI
ncbi:MAG: ribonuclease PH [Caldilineaceae bacterium]